MSQSAIEGKCDEWKRDVDERAYWRKKEIAPLQTLLLNGESKYFIHGFMPVLDEKCKFYLANCRDVRVK
ncbi:MAG: hypothetical protein MJY92_02275 [Bacteroidales bacterium]|nr:hypothetical protein [Bacteroidales bacterium]